MDLYTRRKQNNPRKPHCGEWIVLFCALAALLAVGGLSGKRAPEIRVFEPIHKKADQGVYVMEDRALIDINTADEILLMELNGIGAVRANAIYEYRRENGPFSSVDDILKVPGIGKKTFEQIKDNIIVQNTRLPEE